MRSVVRVRLLLAVVLWLALVVLAKAVEAIV